MKTNVILTFVLENMMIRLLVIRQLISSNLHERERYPRYALDSNVNITFDYIVLVPIVSRIITKDYGGKQG